MKLPTSTLVACGLALLAHGVAAQTARPLKTPSDAARWTKNAKLMGDTVMCPESETKCKVTVEMSQGVVDGLRVCLAKLPEMIKVAGGASNQAKDMVWTLKPSVLPGMALAFQPKHGILVTTNLNGQLGNGRHGASDAEFVLKNKRNKKGDSIYLPVILQTDMASGEVSLCAAADPKVVND